MSEFAVIPDGWDEVSYDVGESLSNSDHTEEFDAVWASTDEKISLHVQHTRDEDGTIMYPVVVEQTLDHEDEPTVTVQSHARVEHDRKSAERVAVEFMHEVNDGLHRLTPIGVEETDEFYEYYCLSDSEIPGDISAEQLIDAIDDEQYDDDIEELPENFDPTAGDPAIQIDVFPRHKNEIENDDD